MAVPSQFDASWYLAHNLDVAQAGADAYGHWLSNGLSEGRSVYQYTESLYLESHADVAAAVARGDFASGWEHYVAFGSAEGRFPFGAYYAQGASTDDSLSFTEISDQNTTQIRGFEGSDSLTGGAGDDLIYGNQGLDLLNGGSGNDTLYGGQNDGPADEEGVLRVGADSLSGGAGDDVIYGNHGGDLIVSGTGSDIVYGGQDNDTIVMGYDTVYGNRGDDLIQIGPDASLSFGRSVLYGGSGADTLEVGYVEYGSVTFADFDPDEGDRIDLSSTIWDGSYSLTQPSDTSIYIYPYGARRVSITIELNRTGFSDEWLL